MTDRPAAEILDEVVPLFNEVRRRGRHLSVWADAYVYALKRLDIAEKTLAELRRMAEENEGLA